MALRVCWPLLTGLQFALLSRTGLRVGSMPLQGAGSSSAGGAQVSSMQDYGTYPKEFTARRLVVFVGIVIG